MNYYARFLQTLSTILHPLYRLLEKDHQWHWTKHCDEVFMTVKKLIRSDKVLTHYDPNLPLCLATDASPYGLGAVLSHIMANSEERPIAYASRSLSVSEKNYSQIEKEALGIIFGKRRFNTYVYGRQFRLITDHEPLTSIFRLKKGIANTTAEGVQRYALFLAGYNYGIMYRSTKKHGNADSLSRLPVVFENDQLADMNEEAEVDMFHVSLLEHLPVKPEAIQQETRRDYLLSKVYDNVTNG